MNYKTLNKKEIGLKIFTVISNSGKPLDEIAKFLKLSSPRVIYDWMSGKKLPNCERLCNLSALLNVRMEEILAL